MLQLMMMLIARMMKVIVRIHNDDDEKGDSKGEYDGDGEEDEM